MASVRLELDGTITTTDTRTLAEAQAGRIDALKAERDALIAKGMTYSGKPLQIDEASQQRMASMVLRAQVAALPPGFAWVMGDDSTLPITSAADMIALATAAANRVIAVRAAYQAARTAVRATTTREEADAVVAAWPA